MLWHNGIHDMGNSHISVVVVVVSSISLFRSSLIFPHFMYCRFYVLYVMSIVDVIVLIVFISLPLSFLPSLDCLNWFEIYPSLNLHAYIRTAARLGVFVLCCCLRRTRPYACVGISIIQDHVHKHNLPWETFSLQVLPNVQFRCHSHVVMTDSSRDRDVK